MFQLLQLLLHLRLEVMEQGVVRSHKTLKKTVGIHLKMTRFPLDLLRRDRFKPGPMCCHLGHMTFVVDVCMDAVLEDTQLRGNAFIPVNCVLLLFFFLFFSCSFFLVLLFSFFFFQFCCCKTVTLLPN